MSKAITIAYVAFVCWLAFYGALRAVMDIAEIVQ